MGQKGLGRSDTVEFRPDYFLQTMYALLTTMPLKRR